MGSSRILIEPMKRQRYFSNQRILEVVGDVLQSLLLQGPVYLAVVGFLFFGGISIFFNKDIISKIDSLGEIESYLRYTEYTTGVAGLFLTLITIFLVLYSLHKTKGSNNKQLFETKFFDLLKIHRDNTSQMEYCGNNGRKTFELIHEEVAFVSKHLSREFPSIETNDRVAIAYLVVFWGLEDSLEDLRRYLYRHYSFLGQTIDDLLSNLLKLHDSINSHDSVSPYKGRFHGVQSILSHYFRHLYQTVVFVNRQSYLEIDDKYFFIKTLRAQLSNFEMSIFFFNSLCPLGRMWESAQPSIGKKLITKYQLIKNMPTSLAIGVKLKMVYPEIEFESEEH